MRFNLIHLGKLFTLFLVVLPRYISCTSCTADAAYFTLESELQSQKILIAFIFMFNLVFCGCGSTKGVNRIPQQRSGYK